MSDPTPTVEVELDSAELKALEDVEDGELELDAEATPAKSAEAERVVEAWRHELGIMVKEAEALAQTDSHQAALLYGAASALHLSILGDPAQAEACLADAERVAKTPPSWLHSMRFRLAMCRGDYGAATPLIRSALATQGDPRERAGLLLLLSVCEEIVHKNPSAAEHGLKDASDLVQNDVPVLWALVEHYTVSKQPEPLVRTLRALIDSTQTPTHRSMLHQLIGALEESVLNNPSNASAGYERALADEPNNLLALISMASLSLKDRNYRELGLHMLSEAGLLDDARAVRRLTERAGDLYWEHLRDGESAVAAYQKAVAAAPHDLVPLRKLANVLEALGRWSELIENYRAQLTLEQLPDERAELYHRAGEVFEYYLGSVDEAEVSYQAALTEEPTHLATMVALETLYRRNERWSDLMRLGLIEAERATEVARRADRYFEVARIVADRLDNSADALKLLEHCADLQPGHRAAFETREDIYLEEQRYHDLAQLYEEHLTHLKDPVLRRYLTQELGRLYKDRLSNRKLAAQRFADSLKIEAKDLSDLLQLIRIHEAEGDFAALAQSLETLLSSVTDSIDQIAILHRLARVYEQELKRQEDALKTHHRVLKIDSSNTTSLRAIASLHYRGRRWSDLILAYREQFALATAKDERATILYRIGRIEERRLGKLDDAVKSYQAALEEIPFQPALRALDRVLRQQEKWETLIAVLRKEVERARQQSEKGTLLASIGQLFELHLNKLDEAEAAYSEALDEHPEADAVLWALCQVRERQGKDKRTLLLATYEQLLEQTDRPRTRVSLLVRVGLLCEQLGDLAKAAQSYRSGFDLSRMSEALLLSYLNASRVQFGYDGAGAAYRVVAPRTKDATFAHALLLLGALREEILGQEAGALYADTYDLGSRHVSLLDGLIRSYLRDGVTQKGFAPSESLIIALTERAQGQEGILGGLAHLEAASLADRLGKVRDAALEYETAARELHDFLPVLRGIRRIAVGKAQWSSVVTLLLREAEVAKALGNKTAALMQAGEVLSTHLKDYRQSLKLYRQVLELDPTEERAFHRAQTICEKLADYDTLASILHAQADAATDPLNRAALLKAEAVLYQNQLTSPRRAIQCLRAAIAADSSDVEAHLALAPLEVAENFWQEAVGTYHRLGELSRGTETSRTARLTEARLLDEKLGDRDGARRVLEELVVDPTDREAAVYMAQLCEKMGRWLQASEYYRQLLAGAGERERLQHLLSLASLERTRLNKAADSRRTLIDALGLALGNPELIPIVEKKLLDSGDGQLYVDVAEEALKNARVVAPPQAQLHKSVARVYREHLGRADLAENHLKASISIDPDDPASFVQLANHQLREGRGDLAQAHYRKALELQPLNDEALAGLAALLEQKGTVEEARLIADVGVFLKNGQASPRPGGALFPTRPLDEPSLSALFPRQHTSAAMAIAEIFKQLDPVAGELVGELSAFKLEGNLLLDADPITQLSRQLSAVFELSPLRVYVDPQLGHKTQLCSDGSLAFAVGKELISPFAQGKLVFTLVCKLYLMAEHLTLAAFVRPGEMTQLLQLLGNENPPEAQKELRRRFLKPMPRRVRKEIERLLATDVRNLATDMAAFYAETQRIADRLGLILSREPGAALELIAEEDRTPVKHSPRAIELIRYTTSEQLLRTYQRLT